MDHHGVEPKCLECGGFVEEEAEAQVDKQQVGTESTSRTVSKRESMSNERSANLSIKI